MIFNDYMGKLEGFTSKLGDEESKRLFDARFLFLLNKNRDLLEDSLLKASQNKENIICPVLDKYFQRQPSNSEKPFLIYGKGLLANRTERALKTIGKTIICVSDSICEIIDNYKDCIIYIAKPMELQIKAIYQLQSLGIKENDILFDFRGGLYCDYGWQYFDLEKMKVDKGGEYFVDAGCFDGKTSESAEKWAKGMMKKIYAFEPDNTNLKRCRARLQDLKCDYELFNLATWDEKNEVSFEHNDFSGSGSKVAQSGSVTISADSIDNVLKGQKVTFIKLDVEGSELKTLKGSISTIKKFRPKMAISIYHKPEDIIEIPIFIESLNLNYMYYIRHYQSREYETILYAI